ncbi:SpoIID/LytB domain-containing protein [Paenibacillus sp. NEAU-GSW1]|uniref:SpoIID/LytB domain-containing protein n=1 Tax=Paenibacillus sp. NEAU-GSW1 TaxID=2682486 RepID=UPI0012E11DE6|nr:SpoIID/LytB domain-containing protein [Paenibacillus sp. NEAU-GSW1]MUT67291.1 SpoIID/LytB domain-containing protein [Paenibacillus sp. NEAU-GSW1]
MKTNRWSYRRLTLLTIIGLLLISTWTAKPSLGAVPKLDSIRVAIFLQFPGKYQVNTPVATLSSSGGLSVGMRKPSGTEAWTTLGADVPAKFAVDDYKVKIVETGSFDTALKVQKRIQSASGAGFITSLTKNGKTVYQVAEGSYSTAADAAAALKKWSADSELLGIAGGVAPVLSGPLHLESAAYKTRDEAVKAADTFSAAGIDAYIAQRSAASYTVMVGAEADAASLELIKKKAGAAGATLKQASAEPYLLYRNDHTTSGKAANPAQLFAFPAGTAKVWVAPRSTASIKLTERSNRTYRGEFELSEFNGKLAVINELPFEHYLYSVVGGEMSPSWSIEALKAQAVSARTYALYQGFGFQIAHVVDSVTSQAYYGTEKEKPETIRAVDETAGEVMLYKGKLIEALFSSSAGGQTADAKEIWGNSVAYLQTVSSPDKVSEKNLHQWYRVALPSGLTGYVRDDLLDDTGEVNQAGVKTMKVNTEGTKVRVLPIIQDSVPLVGQLGKGTQVAILDRVVQNNEMSWIRGPFTSNDLVASMKGRTSSAVSGPISSLEISKQGVSGRVTEMLVNGSPLPIKYPDSLRGALGGLPSTLFQVDETAKVTMIGAGGETRTRSTSAQPIYTIGADGKVKQQDDNLFVLSGDGKVRATTKETSFRFIGTGNGHGVGMSQYGALGLAQQGYDYSYILKYYYKDVTIAKE